MAETKNGDWPSLTKAIKGAVKKWLTDPNKVEKNALVKSPDEPSETKPNQKPLDEWRYRFSYLCLPEEITKRAASYEEKQKFLARSDEENLEIYQDKKQVTEHRFDKISEYSFWGAIISIGVGGLCVWIGLSPMFWAGLCGLGAGSAFIFDRLAHQVHLKEMEVERQSALEECEDKLNEYAYLLVGAVSYINAQIQLWNMRLNYLIQNLAEPTDKDILRCTELKATHQDFEQHIKRLEHFFYLRQCEKNFLGQGIELDRLHSGLNEHLDDLKPIVPKIATDPLMLEAIKDMEAIFTENSEQELNEKIENLKAKLAQELPTAPTEILIEEDVEEQKNNE